MLTGYPIGVYNPINKDTLRGYIVSPVRNVKGDILMADNSHKENVKQEECCCCSGKTKEREDKEFKDLMNRLKRIEGQVRGVENMLENDAYCTDILVQVLAITSALNSFNKVLLANHMKTCVAENIREGNDEVIDELVCTLQKLMK